MFTESDQPKRLTWDIASSAFDGRKPIVLESSTHEGPKQGGVLFMGNDTGFEVPFGPFGEIQR
jgi:hypothetical protein